MSFDNKKTCWLQWRSRVNRRNVEKNVGRLIEVILNVDVLIAGVLIEVMLNEDMLIAGVLIEVMLNEDYVDCRCVERRLCWL